MRLLVALFLLSIPLINPQIHGDGVGYYAWLRAPLVERSFDFTQDWLHGNDSFLVGQLRHEEERTQTGRVNNWFTIGPAILWLPFVTPVHLALGADGFGLPYRLAMALGTALYGFLGLLLAFSIARKYTSERAALFATVGVWFASSLPVYMYFNPAWSHAHSAFTVALFLWYWDRTRGARTLRQWAAFGLAAGLMIEVYYLNAIALVVVAREVCLRSAAVFGAAVVVALLPTFISRSIVFGGPFDVGLYSELPWDWTAPALADVLFSSYHGAFSWTPVLILAVVGLVFLRDRALAVLLGVAFCLFWYVLACYPRWHGDSSFGSRFLISLTPVFVIGLAATLDRLRAAYAALPALIVWNLAFIFQWGTGMLPPREPISWREMAHNQVTAVPARIGGVAAGYLFRRGETMREIEARDVERRRAGR
jgi:hypothetical protein